MYHCTINTTHCVTLDLSTLLAHHSVYVLHEWINNSAVVTMKTEKLLSGSQLSLIYFFLHTLVTGRCCATWTHLSVLILISWLQMKQTERQSTVSVTN